MHLSFEASWFRFWHKTFHQVMNYFNKNRTVFCLSGFSVGQLCLFKKNTSERHPLCFQFGAHSEVKNTAEVLSLFSSRAKLCILMLCFWLFSNHQGRVFLLCCFLFNLQNNCKVLEWLQYPLQHECFLSSREMLMVSLGWLSDRLLIENSWFFFFIFFFYWTALASCDQSSWLQQ